MRVGHSRTKKDKTLACTVLLSFWFDDYNIVEAKVWNGLYEVDCADVLSQGIAKGGQEYCNILMHIMVKLKFHCSPKRT